MLQWIPLKNQKRQNESTYIVLPAFSSQAIDIDLSTFFELSRTGNYTFYLQSDNMKKEVKSLDSFQQDSNSYLDSYLELKYKTITELDKIPTSSSLDPTDIKEASMRAFNLSLSFELEKKHFFCEERWPFIRNCLFYNFCLFHHAKLSPDELHKEKSGGKRKKTNTNRFLSSTEKEIFFDKSNFVNTETNWEIQPQFLIFKRLN